MKIFSAKSLFKFSRTFLKNTYKLNLSSREELIRRILTEPENEVLGEDIKTLAKDVKYPHQLVELTKDVTKIAARLNLEGYEVGYNLKKKPVRVAVTGAAGNISYSLLFRIASGELLGKDQPVILHLLEIPQALKSLEGVAMELNDCSFSLLRGIVITDKLEVGFKDVDYAFLVGAKPRGKGMERKDLLLENAKIFQEQGKALNKYAKNTTLTLIVGNPANTNCLIASSNAPDIPNENFSAMMRLDHNRAISQLAEKKQSLVTDIKNVIIWGNHSSTQVPDLSNALVKGQAALEGLDEEWEDQFISKVQQRGAEIIAARGLSSAFSAADAALKHMRDWVLGTNGEYVSMGVPSNGLYGLKNHIYCSFPVICLGDGKIKVVEDIKMNSKIKKRFKDSVKELEDEKDAVKDLLGKKN